MSPAHERTRDHEHERPPRRRAELDACAADLSRASALARCAPDPMLRAAFSRSLRRAIGRYIAAEARLGAAEGDRLEELDRELSGGAVERGANEALYPYLARMTS